MTQPHPQSLLTLRTVQDLTKLSRTTIYRLTRSGHLTPVYFGRALRFREIEIAQLIQTGVVSTSDSAGS